MARPSPLLFCTALAGAVLLSTTAQAQIPNDTTIGLSDAQKAEILSHNTEATVADARAGVSNTESSGDLPGSGGLRAIHGEIGAEIGTHGERGMYGTAAIPLGDHAGATVSVRATATAIARRVPPSSAARLPSSVFCACSRHRARATRGGHSPAGDARP